MSIDIEATGDGGRAVTMGAPPLQEQLPVLPLRDTVTFPDTLTPLAVGQERSVRLVNDVLAGDRMLVVELPVAAPGDARHVPIEPRS